MVKNAIYSQKSQVQTSVVMTIDGIEPVMHRWLDRLRKRDGLTNSSIRTYRSVLRNLTAWNGCKPCLYLDADEIGRWVDHLAETGIDTSTRRTYIGVIAGFFAWTVTEGLRTDNPAADLGRPKARRRLPRPMPEEEFAKALQLADADMKCILALAGFAGLRAMEVAGLRWEDVDLDGMRSCLFVCGKGGKDRYVDISPELAEILRALPHRTGYVIRRLDGGSGPNAAITISHRASHYLRDIGVPRTLHTLRHRFCTVMLAVTKNLRAVQEAAGHSDISTTAPYAAVARVAIREGVLATGKLHLSPPEAA